VVQGDRVACIAPNTHAQLEAFYAVPQLGAVLVPLNYRLLPSDWVYMVNHSGSRVVCVHQDYLDLVDKVRHEMPAVEHFVALEGGGKGWLGTSGCWPGKRPTLHGLRLAKTTCSPSITPAARRPIRKA
jgi:fatty-acyl-CoA synthase